jgi:hypothetical protein
MKRKGATESGPCDSGPCDSGPSGPGSAKRQRWVPVPGAGTLVTHWWFMI